MSVLCAIYRVFELSIMHNLWRLNSTCNISQNAIFGILTSLNLSYNKTKTIFIRKELRQ